MENDIRGEGDAEERVYENSVEKYDGTAFFLFLSCMCSFSRVGVQGGQVNGLVVGFGFGSLSLLVVFRVGLLAWSSFVSWTRQVYHSIREK